MSIYSTKQMVEAIDQMNLTQAKSALKRLVGMNVSSTMKARFAHYILNEAAKTDADRVLIGEDRIVAAVRLQSLLNSPILEYAYDIIEAALAPGGPRQSRDILMMVAAKRGGAYFLDPEKGIPQAVKNEAGMILSAAGLERRSFYHKEKKMPVKGWKTRPDYYTFSVEDRMAMVLGEIGKTVSPPEKVKNKPLPTLESFI